MRARRRRRRGARASRRRDLSQVARQILFDDELPDDRAAAVDEEDPRDRQSAPPRQHLAVTVVDAWIRDPVLALPLARVGPVVLRVDAEERDAIAVARHRRLE